MNNSDTNFKILKIASQLDSYLDAGCSPIQVKELFNLKMEESFSKDGKKGFNYNTIYMGSFQILENLMSKKNYSLFMAA